MLSTPAAFTVPLHRFGNFVEIPHAHVALIDPSHLAAIQQILTYDRRRLLMGWEARKARQEGFGRVQVTTVPLYRVDRRGSFVFGKGMLPRVMKQFREFGYHCLVVPEQRADAGVYAEDWDNLMFHFAGKLRPRQDEAIAAIAAHEFGIIDAPTGFGKTICLASIPLLYPNAQCDIVLQGKDLVQKTSHELSRWLPNVGQVWSGCRRTDRVTIYSADSLHHSDGNADFLIADEVHRLGTARYANALSKYKHSRNFGLSASVNQRFDGADLEIEALFGPVIFKMTYQEAVKLGLVSQIRVEWLNVYIKDNPCAGVSDLQREPVGIWRNNDRNQIIAAKALSYPPNVQVLVMARTLEHVLHLRKYLPGWEICHSEQAIKAADLAYYRNNGLLTDDDPPMTRARRENLRRGFEDGYIKKAICTGVWSTGVNFVSLQVLVRADAMASEIADTQIPGRVCRIDGVKERGILVDCADQFDEGFCRKAKARRSSYAGHGWEQISAGNNVGDQP